MGSQIPSPTWEIQIAAIVVVQVRALLRLPLSLSVYSMATPRSLIGDQLPPCLAENFSTLLSTPWASSETTARLVVRASILRYSSGNTLSLSVNSLIHPLKPRVQTACQLLQTVLKLAIPQEPTCSKHRKPNYYKSNHTNIFHVLHGQQHEILDLPLLPRIYHICSRGRSVREGELSPSCSSGLKNIINCI